MRKLIVLLLALLMVFSFVSCKNEPEDSGSNTAKNSDEDKGKTNLVAQGAAVEATSKAVDNKGFKVVGKYQYGEELINVEVGGKDGIYWIGHDDNYTNIEADPVFTYQFFTETANTDGSYTIKLWDGSAWNEYPTTTSIKDALFGDGGFADQILYCSFELEDYGFGEAVNQGKTTHNGRECTKFTAEYYADLSAYGFGSDTKVADAVLYVDSDFFITLALEVEIDARFKSSVETAGLAVDDLIKFFYEVEPNFALTSVDLPDGYSAAKAAL